MISIYSQAILLIWKNTNNEKIKFLERDIALDSDKTLGIDIYKSFVNKVEADLYVLLHNLTIFKIKTLDNAVSKVVSGEYDSKKC